MRTFAQIKESKENFKIVAQHDAVNYLSVEDLKKYLKLVDKFLSKDAKEIINYLIVNNTTYLQELDNNTDENALVGFYNAGKPSEKHLQELWTCINNLVKDDRVLEIPILQTQKQFNDIINKKTNADYVIYRLDTEEGRNKVVKKFEPLVHKICRQYHGKSTFTYDELVSAAYNGFIWAFDSYGKPQNDSEYIDDKAYNYTFLQWLAQMMRFSILDEMTSSSRTVRIPKNVLTDEKKKNGQIKKTNTISGDKTIGINNSDDGNKTLFDFIDSQEYTLSDVDRDDLDKLWQQVYDKVKQKFGEKILDIWCSFYGINNKPQLKNKELAKKYNLCNSSITYYCFKVNNFLKTDKSVKTLMGDIIELTQECLQEELNSNGDIEPYIINNNIIDSQML